MPDSKDARRKLWTSPDTFTTTLMVLLVDQFGTRPIGDPDDDGQPWDPATIVLEIEQTDDVALPRITHDRLIVGILLLTTDLFYQSCPDFVNFCNVLGGTPMDPNNWDPADCTELAWGITEGLYLTDPEEDEPFTEEILAYIGKALDQEGIANPPDVLRIAQRDGRNQYSPGEFSDDPEMFSAIDKFERDKTQDIQRTLRDNFRRLQSQLAALELSTGSLQALRSARR